MLEKIFIIVLSFLPLSYLVIRGFQELFRFGKFPYHKTSTILLDPPGILTRNKLEVRSIFFDYYQGIVEGKGEFMPVRNLKEKTKLEIEKRELKKVHSLELMGQISALCQFPGEYFPTESKIEKNLENFFESCNLFRKKITHGFHTIEKIEDSKDGIYTIVTRNLEKKILAFSKGDARFLLKNATRVLVKEKKKEIDKKERKILEERLRKLEREGQKVIAFAYKEMPKKQLEVYNPNYCQSDLVFVGMIGIADSLVEKEKESLEILKNLGLQIHLLSDLEQKKALSLGREFGIWNGKNYKIFNKNNFSEIKDFDFQEKTGVFLELRPEQKQILVNQLKEKGQTISFLDQEMLEIENISLKKIGKKVGNFREEKVNNQNIFLHNLGAKIIELCILVFTLVFQLPFILSILGILLIEGISFIIGIGILKDLKKSVGKWSFVVLESLFFGIILGVFVILNFIKTGWNFGNQISKELLLSNSYLSETVSLTILALVFFQIFNVLRKSKKEGLEKSESEKINKVSKSGSSLNFLLILSQLVSLGIIYLIFTNLNLQNLFQFKKPTLEGFLNLLIIFGILLSFILLRILIKSDNFHYHLRTSANKLFKGKSSTSEQKN